MNSLLKSLLVFVLLAAAGFAADFAETKKRAEAGDYTAATVLSNRYRFGLGVLQDEAEALKWERKANELRKQPAREQPAREQAAREQPAKEQAAREQAAREAYAKSTDRAVKLIIKGLAIGMSIDAALEVVNERLRGVFNHKYEIERNGRSGAYLKPVFDSSPAKFALFMEFYDPKFHIYNGFNFNFEVECKVNNDVVTRIFLPTELTNALFNTADMQASDFLLQIRQNYVVGVKAEDWTVIENIYTIYGLLMTCWEYSSPEGYRIRVFDNKAIEMEKIPKSNERSFN